MVVAYPQFVPLLEALAHSAGGRVHGRREHTTIIINSKCTWKHLSKMALDPELTAQYGGPLKVAPQTLCGHRCGEVHDRDKPPH
jgi:hypothetical protein